MPLTLTPSSLYYLLHLLAALAADTFIDLRITCITRGDSSQDRAPCLVRRVRSSTLHLAPALDLRHDLVDVDVVEQRERAGREVERRHRADAVDAARFSADLAQLTGARYTRGRTQTEPRGATTRVHLRERGDLLEHARDGLEVAFLSERVGRQQGSDESGHEEYELHDSRMCLDLKNAVCSEKLETYIVTE